MRPQESLFFSFQLHFYSNLYLAAMNRETQFMLEAIRLSGNAIAGSEGGPFGCVIVKGEEVIGRGWNKVTSTNDPTAHAEVVAIREACTFLGTFQLNDCEVFTSCEPCPMCMGAIYWARPKKVYYANTREDAAAIGFDDSFIYKELAVPIEKRCIEMIRLASPEASLVFEAWKARPDKLQY
jgi:guanine deaminase